MTTTKSSTTSLENWSRCRPGRVLAGAALSSAAVYWLVFVRRFPLARYYASIPPLDYAKLTGHTLGGVISFVAGVALLFGIYVTLLRYLDHLRREGKSASGTFQRQAWLVLFLGIAIVCVLLVSAYPTAAIDVLIYAVRTRGWAVHGLNPLATAPGSLPADAWVGLAAEWTDAPSPYGPLWEGLSWLAFHAAGGDLLTHVVWLKGLAAACHLLATGLVAFILNRRAPSRALLGAAAFGMNPILLLESAGNGHNDILMVIFLLLAVRLAQSGPGKWFVLSALGMAALVKITPLLVLPFFILFLWHCRETLRERLALLAANAVLAALVFGGGMASLWPGWETWAVRDLAGGAGRSPFALFVLLFKPWLGTGMAFDITGYGLWGTFSLIYLWSLARALRAGSDLSAGLLLPAAGAFFWFLLLPNQQFHAWYLLWPMAFAVLVIPHPIFNRLAFLGLTSWLAIPLYETLRLWWWDFLTPTTTHLIAVPLVFGLPFVLRLGLDQDDATAQPGSSSSLPALR